MASKPQVVQTEVSFSLSEESSHLEAFLARLGVDHRKDVPAAAFSTIAEDFAESDDDRVLSVEVHFHPKSTASHWTLVNDLAPGKSPPEQVTELSQKLGWKAGVYAALEEEWASLRTAPVEVTFTVGFLLQIAEWTTKLAPPVIKARVPGAKPVTSSVVWEFDNNGPLKTLLIGQTTKTLMALLSGRMETIPRQGMLEEAEKTAWDQLGRFISKKKKKI